MKKLILILLTLTVIVLAACGAQTPPPTEAPTEPAPQLHTLAPTETAAEPEWVEVDSEISLECGGEVLAQGEDFERFAIIEEDGSYSLRFGLSELAAAMLASRDDLEGCDISLDSQVIGGARLSGDCSELTLVGDYTYEELCELATRVRGL